MRSWRLKFLAVIFLAWGIYSFWPASLAPEFPIDDVACLSVEGFRVDANGNVFANRNPLTKDPGSARDVLRVMQRGWNTGDHKRGDDAWLIFERADGVPLEFGILPGHDSRYYEYRVYAFGRRTYRIFRMDRQPFLAAMASVGVTDLDLGRPE
jgi:hypothetical protein